MARRRSRKQPTKEEIQQICEGVGRVIISFSLCEHTLTMALKRIFKLTTLQERALVRPMSLRQKTGLLRRVGKEFLSSSNCKIMNELLDKIEKYVDDRNDLAHSFYGHRHGKFALITFSGEAKLSTRPAPWTPPKLAALASEIQQACAVADNIPLLFPRALKLPKIRQPKPEFAGT